VSALLDMLECMHGLSRRDAKQSIVQSLHTIA
jgi:hypothetical protein